MIGGSFWYMEQKRVAEAQTLFRFPFGGKVTASRGCSRICNPFYDGRVIYVQTAPLGIQLALLVSDRTKKFDYRQTGPNGISVLGWAEINPINQLCWKFSCGFSGCGCDAIFNHAWVERYGSSKTP